jgi:hypothetical protein
MIRNFVACLDSERAVSYRPEFKDKKVYDGSRKATILSVWPVLSPVPQA